MHNNATMDYNRITLDTYFEEMHSMQIISYKEASYLVKLIESYYKEVCVEHGDDNSPISFTIDDSIYLELFKNECDVWFMGLTTVKNAKEHDRVLEFSYFEVGGIEEVEDIFKSGYMESYYMSTFDYSTLPQDKLTDMINKAIDENNKDQFQFLSKYVKN